MKLAPAIGVKFTRVISHNVYQIVQSKLPILFI